MAGDFRGGHEQAEDEPVWPGSASASRFLVARAHPDYPRAMGHVPDPPLGELAGAIVVVCVGAAFLVLGLRVDVPATLLGVWITFCGAIMGRGVWQLVSTWRLFAAPEKVLATVLNVDRRYRDRVDHIEVRHHARLEFENGQRDEFFCSKATAGKLAAGRIGVAFLKRGRLLDFFNVGD
jgi:hypothetical protein